MKAHTSYRVVKTSSQVATQAARSASQVATHVVKAAAKVAKDAASNYPGSCLGSVSAQLVSLFIVLI